MARLYTHGPQIGRPRLEGASLEDGNCVSAVSRETLQAIVGIFGLDATVSGLSLCQWPSCYIWRLAEFAVNINK